MKEFIVLSSNPTNKDTFVTKLQHEEIINDEIFGEKRKKTTYYISGTNQIDIGKKIPESYLFPKYKVEEHPMVNPQTGESFKGKWLHLA